MIPDILGYMGMKIDNQQQNERERERKSRVSLPGRVVKLKAS